MSSLQEMKDSAASRHASLSKGVYSETILLIERLHRRFLDVIKSELERMRINDINNIQTLILHNIGNEELTVGELTNRGYYLGSNVSYNVKNMVENGYLVQERSPHDKRSSRVKLSDKGKDLCGKIDELYKSQVERLLVADIDISSLSKMNVALRNLEQFWTNYIQSFHRL